MTVHMLEQKSLKLPLLLLDPRAHSKRYPSLAHLLRTELTEPPEQPTRMLQKIPHLKIEQGMHQQGSPQRGLNIVKPHRSLGPLNQIEAIELPPLQKPKLERIVEVMRIVSDAVGRIDDLDLKHLRLRILLVTPKPLPRENLKGQIEPRVIGVPLLDPGH
jgi:hypothetical protein